MSDIFEKANNGDVESLSVLLDILYDQESEELFMWVKKALKVEPDNKVFLNYMAICYSSYIYGVDKDLEKSKKYYQKAAELGNSVAAYNLAALYYEEENPKAFNWAQKAYDLGDNGSAGLIALMYAEGIGVSVDMEQAFKWNLIGAEGGDIYAQNRVGLCYLHGDGCTVNIHEAIDWFITAAEGGSGAAADNLSKIYLSNKYVTADMEIATHYAIMAAKATHPELNSLYDIADKYRLGDGIEKNPQKALELYTIVADNGNIACMENVGVYYSYEEHGIPRDVDKAIDYFEKAAALGSEKALHNLEGLYKEKYPDNNKEYYFSKVLGWSENGNPVLMTELAVLYHDGIGVDKNPEKGKELLKIAADKGDARALHIVGHECFEEKNYPKAEKYLKRALEAGNQGAKVLLGRLYTSGGEYSNKEIEGIRILREAAEEDENPEAMYYYARFSEEPTKWLKKSAELGNKSALVHLTDMYYNVGAFNEAAIWARLGVDQGIIGCMNVYADMLYYKKIGTDSEQNMAYTYYERTAMFGNEYGCEKLGECYLFGFGGVAENIEKAIEWLTRALEFQNNKEPETLIHLGYAYSMDGATKNVRLSVKYLNQGINDWNKDKKKNPMYVTSAELLFDMYRESHLDVQAFTLMNKLTNEGFDECKTNLAVCYIDGIGTSKNHGKAKTLLEEVLHSSVCDEQKKEIAREILSKLLRGAYGTDSSISGTVSGGTINQTEKGVAYRPNVNTGQKKNGCYIATCVYGSYDCPNVWVLRRYRDERLAKSFWGRLFIKCYYAISPTVVKIWGNQKWFKNIWTGVLDLFVEKLKRNGFSDQKYYGR